MRSVDGIFQVVRAFDDDEVTHVEGDVNPIRDMEIIQTELRLKDIEWVQKQLESTKRTGRSLGNSSLQDKARKEEIVSNRYRVTRSGTRIYNPPRQQRKRYSRHCQKKTRTSEKWNGRTRRYIIFHYSTTIFSSSSRHIKIDVVNSLQLLTAKPVTYLVNLSEKDYIRKKNKWFVSNHSLRAVCPCFRLGCQRSRPG